LATCITDTSDEHRNTNLKSTFPVRLAARKKRRVSISLRCFFQE